MSNVFSMPDTFPGSISQPVFVIDIDELKARLRLTGADSQDGMAIINDAIQRVRVGLYDQLGSLRIDQIKATAYTVTPITLAQLDRMKASNLEVSWVRLHLLRTMPTLFLDSAALAPEIWNDEGLVRNAPRFQIDKEIKRLQEEIDNALAELGGSTDEGGLQVSTIGPLVAPPRPMESIGLVIQ